MQQNRLFVRSWCDILLVSDSGFAPFARVVGFSCQCSDVPALRLILLLLRDQVGRPVLELAIVVVLAAVVLQEAEVPLLQFGINQLCVNVNAICLQAARKQHGKRAN